MKTNLENFQTTMLFALASVLGMSLLPVLAADSNFTDANWSSMGGFPGGNGAVYAAVMDGSGNLYISGDFTSVGDVIAHGIAKWNGTNWSALGTIANTIVNALAVSGSDVYAAGDFTPATVGGITVAKWDGTSWSPLGSGLDSSVRSLAVSGSDLYVGGSFTTASGIAANYIAKWNGSRWSALGSGIEGRAVYALAVLGGDLYAGGHFSTAGGSPANFIARWNGIGWSALGSGSRGDAEDGPPYVYALAVSGSELYVGGYFAITNAGGIAATNIAKWDGNSWSPLGSGLGGGFPNTYVAALAVSGSDLYVGGRFATAGGIAATGMAKWNGSKWSALGSGLGGTVRDSNQPVSALAVSGSDLYVGGDFVTAGGKVSPGIAHAYLLDLPALSVLRSGSDIKISWPSADTITFSLEQAGTLSTLPSWLANTAPVTDDGAKKSVTVPSTNSAQFFRLRRP